MTVVAVIGATALALLYAWLALTIVASYLSGRKGYGEKIGLATGMIFPPAFIVWLLIPPKPESDWKKVGPFGRGKPGEAAKMGRGGPGGAGPTPEGPSESSAG
jgi:hypothetical protein